MRVGHASPVIACPPAPLPGSTAGQRSCLGLARAAYAAIRSGGPAVLLLDECTAGLDSAAVQLLMRRLLGRGGLLDGCTRIMATSDPSLLPHFDTLVAVQVGGGACLALPPATPFCAHRMSVALPPRDCEPPAFRALRRTV